MLCLRESLVWVLEFPNEIKTPPFHCPPKIWVNYKGVGNWYPALSHLIVVHCHFYKLLVNGWFLPPAKEVCGGYVFTGVCLSTGGCVWHTCPLGTHAPQACTPPQHACEARTCTPLACTTPWTCIPPDMQTPQACTPHPGMHDLLPPQRIVWDAVNEWVIRILLECILFVNESSWDKNLQQISLTKKSRIMSSMVGARFLLENGNTSISNYWQNV